MFKGNQEVLFKKIAFRFPFMLEAHSSTVSTNAPPQVGSEGSQNCQQIFSSEKNLCKRPAATQRDVPDGRVTVPSSDGLPRWRGIRELEAELWKLFLVYFTFSHWQSHTLLSCAFGGWRSQMRGLISPRKSSLVWAPAVLFQRGRCHQATNCTQSSFLTLVWRWLSNGHLRAIYNWPT